MHSKSKKITNKRDKDGILKTTCFLCHGGCVLRAHIREGKLVNLEGDPGGPLNLGSICEKGKAAVQYVYSPYRLRHPLKRAGKRGAGNLCLHRIPGSQHPACAAACNAGAIVFGNVADPASEISKTHIESTGSCFVLKPELETEPSRGPILMTTLKTILGLLPLAMGIGEGSDAQAPLARAVVGGLTGSTLISLVLIPVVYSLFHPDPKASCK